MHKLIYLSCFILLTLISCEKNDRTSAEGVYSSDVVIYGGTSAAVSAAVQLSRMGRSVVVVCPETHLGGLTASGLGFTDTGNKEVIGGIAREFYHRVYKYYGDPETWKWEARNDYGNKGQGTPAIDGENRTMWIFEPHIAENVFEDLVKEENITVIRDAWLDRSTGVKVNQATIESITMEDGTTFQADIFIDATYEGDLMAAAGVSYHVGRESLETYGEKWNGVQVGVLHHGHHFGDMNISPYIVPGDPESGVLPRISTEHPGEKGAGDDKVQAYCYRTCLTKVEENRVPFHKPENYNANEYALLPRIFAAGWNEVFNKFDAIPNAKTDVNNHGPFSFDNIGMNYDYPEGTYEQRKEIIEEHINYQQGLLYYLANDPEVPEQIRSEMSQWGYARDEFVDTDHWPHQIYVREARRMIGDYVMTEHEIMGDTYVEQPIGMGSYTMDSHNTQRYITPDGYVQNEGDIGVHPGQPYSIALGTVVPRQAECKNLLVPVAVSSSHIAFGSIRMEPVFMILGQSAATLAGLALDQSVGIHDISYEDLKSRLVEDGQVLRWQAEN